MRSPVCSVWPERVGRWRIFAVEALGSSEVTAMVAAILGVLARFLWLGARGRRGGPSHHVGGAGGGTGWRRYASAPTIVSFHERGEEDDGEERKSGQGERKRRRGWHGIARHLQGNSSVAWAASRRWPRRAPGSLHAGAPQRRQMNICKNPLWLWGFLRNFWNNTSLHHLVIQSTLKFSK
jgi:hypothetical protein